MGQSQEQSVQQLPEPDTLKKSEIPPAEDKTTHEAEDAERVAGQYPKEKKPSSLC